MLDFERRYTNIYLASTLGTSQAAQGGADTQCTGPWSVRSDSSQYPTIIPRTRLMFRYLFSPYSHGTAVGIAVSF